MKRPAFAALALVAGFAAVLVAQDQVHEKKLPDESKGKDLLANVAKNMKSAEERLKQQDPGDVTRKIQRDIIDDLDALIKQNEKSQGGGGSTKKLQPKQSAEKSGQKQQQQGADMKDLGDPKKGDNGEEKDGHGKAKGSKEDDGQQAAKKDKGEGKDGEVKEANGGPMGQAKKLEQAKDGKDGQEGGLAKVKHDQDAKAKTNVAADLYRDPWGHLPETKRLEMDAYSKERFMPRYDDLLRQYYRTIAEQSLKKND